MSFRLLSKSSLFVALLVFSCSVSYAQKVQKVKGVEGRYQLSRHITEEQAEERALNEAKQEALRKAGVAENIWSVFGMITTDDGVELQEAYSEMSLMAVNGMVNITKRDFKKVVESGVTFVVATIDAEVKAAASADKTYQIDVEGISSIYRDGDILNFNITLYGSSSYIRIFWFNSSGGALVFPNDYEPDVYFPMKTALKFPTKDIDYIVELQDKKKDSEKVNIMIVATKKDYPYISREVTFNSVLKWIYDIPADERCSSYHLLQVRK